MEHIDEGQGRLVGRRRMLQLIAPGLVLGAAAIAGRPAAADLPTITMYKSPYCGCCGLWAKYLHTHGYRVKPIMSEDLEPIKLKAGVPENLATCHTAFIGDYVVEGHVPLPAIEKMLKERPKILGIAVPGMPAGSPGMPSIEAEPYKVFAFDAEGKQTVFMAV